MAAQSHKKAINNMKDLSSLVTIINDSKINYLKKNLSIHLHTSQITLLNQVKKHSKPHHKQIRIKKYELLLNDSDKLDAKFELHKNLYIKKYQKLEKKGLVEVITEPEETLPFDVVLTKKGEDLLEEISKLEKEWEKEVTKDIENNEDFIKSLQQVAQIAFPISYKFKKQQKFVF